jgi:predicted nucleic acid-binding protein
LVKTPYFFIEKRELIIKVLDDYREISVDLFDVYLFYLARSENKEVISFDKDFKKLK